MFPKSQKLLMVLRACVSRKYFPETCRLQISRTFHFQNRSNRPSKCRTLTNIANQCIISHHMQCNATMFRHTTLLCASNASLGIMSYSSEATKTVYDQILASEPVHLSQSVLEYGHSITGLPWWASIAMTTITLRIMLTFPLSVYSQNIRARIENLKPEMAQNARRIFQQRFAARAKQEKWNEIKMKKVANRMMQISVKQLYIRDNCHPAKASIMLLTQIPLWLCISLSLRNMTGAISSNVYLDPEYVVPALADGGTLWFSNLILPDPLYILPVAVGVVNLINVELQTLTGRPVTRFQKAFTNLLRCLSVVMIPVAAFMPSAMSLYWMTSATYSLAQNVLLKLPTVCRAMHIVPSGSDSDTPFQDINKLLKQKYSRNKSDKQKAD